VVDCAYLEVDQSGGQPGLAYHLIVASRAARDARSGEIIQMPALAATPSTAGS
jgi:hypothetical protein